MDNMWKSKNKGLMAQSLEIGAFNELLVAEPSPQAQIHAVYGVRQDVRVLDQLSATVTATGGEFRTRTGGDAFAVGVATAKRPLVYKSGQGALGRLTARFDPGADGTVLGAGLFSNSEGIYFGYLGPEFSIVHARRARASVQVLTLTAGASGAETATLTIDGTAYNVPITAGTPAFNAYELEVALAGVVTNWEFQQEGDTLVFNQTVPLVTTGAFTYTSDGTSAGTIEERQAGTQTINDIIPQSQWNIDTRPDLDPQTYNVFQIRYQYLGAGVIEYGIEEAETGEFKLVHRVKWPNANTLPTLGNPSLLCGWLARSLGGTDDLSVYGISAMTAIEGTDDAPTNFNASTTVEQATVNSTERTHLILRNRAIFADVLNLGIVEPQYLSVANEGSKPVIIRIYGRAVQDGVTNYTNVDADNSIVQFDSTQNTLLSAGAPLIQFTVQGGSGDPNIDLSRLQNEFLANETLVVTSQVVSGGTTADVTISIGWEEIT